MKDNIFAVELSYDTAPENICDIMSKSAQDINYLHDLVKQNGVPYFIVNTCRRFTVFTTSSCPGRSIRFFESLNVGKKYLKIFKAEKAVQHLLEIAGGLKSPNLGEHEILHQVKNVIKESEALNILDVNLKKLLQKAIETGKRIRTETNILQNNLTYPAIVNKILKEQNQNVAGQEILVIGNGKLGNSLVKYFLVKKARLTLATRSAQDKTKPDKSVKIISREEITKYLSTFQIVIGAAGTKKLIITKKQVIGLKNKPLFIDLAIPANIDPEINTPGNQILFNLDYIFKDSIYNKNENSTAVKQAENIVMDETEAFLRWQKSRKAVGIINTLKEELNQIKSEEQKRLLADLGDIDLHQQKVITSLINRLTSRIAHTHYNHIKNFVVNGYS